MNSSHYSVNIHWDKRYPKAGTADLCPVQLSVNLGGLQFKISLRLYATHADWTKAMQPTGGSAEVKALRKQIQDFVAKAEALLQKMANPTRESFQRLFKSETDLFISSKTSVSVLWNEYIIQLEDEERFKTALNFKRALQSLSLFQPKLFFEDIDVPFLEKYHNWMLGRKRSVTTVQIYLRALRVIFNRAIKGGLIASRHYPFSSYSIGSSVKTKKALYTHQIKSLFQYEGSCMSEQRAIGIFFFCFLANGANPKDVLQLKFSDIKGEMLYFTREKTKRTNKVAGKQIAVYLHPMMRAILATWGNKPDPDSYLFPFLNGCPTPKAREQRRMTWQRRLNMTLNKVGRKLGFQLNMGMARHSFATRLKLEGTPVAFISDAMGHSNTKTTEHYLKSIPDNNIRTMSETLLRF